MLPVPSLSSTHEYLVLGSSPLSEIENMVYCLNNVYMDHFKVGKPNSTQPAHAGYSALAEWGPGGTEQHATSCALDALLHIQLVCLIADLKV